MAGLVKSLARPAPKHNIHLITDIAQIVLRRLCMIFPPHFQITKNCQKWEFLKTKRSLVRTAVGLRSRREAVSVTQPLVMLLCCLSYVSLQLVTSFKQDSGTPVPSKEDEFLRNPQGRGGVGHFRFKKCHVNANYLIASFNREPFQN